MKKLFKTIISGIVAFLFCSNIGFSAITAENSPHGGMFFIQKATQASLTLDNKKGQLKLTNCDTVIAPEDDWHFEAILSENYVKLFCSGKTILKQLVVPGILVGTTSINNKNMTVIIPIQANDPVQEGNNLLYKSVMTKMENIPRNLTLSHVSLVLYPPKMEHEHNACFWC